ncbi:hypothetical protein AB0305_03915 [Arthrobacter sp. NPDC080086]|uniref:hypothetical protein n=1 Tax=Arthrobacter sp. NPDC080086 TaxID=3155917 RepID=UPI00344B4806
MFRYDMSGALCGMLWPGTGVAARSGQRTVRGVSARHRWRNAVRPETRAKPIIYMNVTFQAPFG